MLTACATHREQEQPAVTGGDLAQVEGDISPVPGPLPVIITAVERQIPQTTTTAEAGAAEYVASTPTLYKGNDRFVRMPETTPPVTFRGEDVALNFEQAPLTEVVHAIMGNILQLDYIVEHPIGGQVTLRTRAPVPRNQLLGILESLLRSNSALMLRDKDGRYFISASPQATKIKPGISSPHSLSAGYSTVVVPLRYVGAREMAEILRPVADEAAFVRIDAARNLLMLAGTKAQLEGWLELVNTFDVDMLQGMSVGIFPLDNSTVEDVESALSGLLGRNATLPEGGEQVAGVGEMVRIIPVERLNSLLVVTPRAHYLQQVGKWIERLDRVPESSFEQRLFVYPVQNSNAIRLAELLSSIFAETSGGGVGRASAVGVSPGLTPETVTASGSGQAGAGSRSTRTSRTGSERRNFEVSGVRVIADEENNALLIYATGKNYAKIEAAIKRLDLVATQVIIEASILEVRLTDELRYGLEWTFKNSVGDDYSGFGQLITTGRDVAAIAPGFSYTVTNSVGDISAVLNALAEKSLINVISTPSVMVLDNHTASIHVGDQVPVETSTTVTDGGNQIRSIEFRDTGVKLSVTPSVNAGGMVVMDIEQSVTDVGEIDIATGQRSFLERNIESRVAVRTDESVVLGGLIRENASTGKSGIPLLHDIPVIGNLFGSTDNSDRRTELLVIITPRVLFNEADLREVSREMRERMRHFDLIDVTKSSQLRDVEMKNGGGTHGDF
jgi:general secretion pathway protein D